MKHTNKSGPAAWLSLLRILGRFFGMATMIVGSWSCSSQGDLEKTESITLADLPLASSALFYIAEHQGYFSENDLDITLAPYESGVATMDALLEGKADLANMTEFVLVRNALQKQPVSMIGTMNRNLAMEMIGLRKHGVSNLSDLMGKHIGLTRGTITEFYLGRLLDLHGMNIKDVVLVDLPQSEWLAAISSGDVDAIVGWPPYTLQIKERFLSEAVAWRYRATSHSMGFLLLETSGL